MTLGRKLKQIRIEKKLTQTTVAEYLNITRQSISKWENDNGYPDLDNLIHLSEYYEVSLDELLKENLHLKEQFTTVNNTPKISNSIKNLKNESDQDEGFALLIISLIGCLVSPLGLIIALVVLKRNKISNTFYKGVIVASLICILVNFWGTYALLSTFFHWGSSPNVEYLGYLIGNV